MEESAKEYGTFYACYTYSNSKNTYSLFLVFFDRIGVPPQKMFSAISAYRVTHLLFVKKISTKFREGT